MKSIAVTILWPCWEWIARPELRYLFCSYSAGLAVKHSLDRRRVIESEWYRTFWTHVQLCADQNQKAEYENTARGVMVATSIGGTVTGKGGNRIILDDPLNPEQASSEAERERANEFFDKTLTTRLDDKRSDAIVIVGQRVHDDDLTGHVLSRSAGWTHLKLPAIEDKAVTVTFPRSAKSFTREAGEPLWERREGLEQLAAMKHALGSAAYAAQYQQEPAPPEGALIKAEWWRSYRVLPQAFDEQLQSWDMAFKGEASSDYVVGQVWGRRGAEIYLLDQVRGQWDIQRTIDALLALSAKWSGALLKLVEDRANGPAIISLLQKTPPGICALSPSDSKEARCSAVAPAIEAGNVKVPDPRYVVGAEWVEDFLLEFSRFPRGRNDDQVDAATQALGRLVPAATAGEISIGPQRRLTYSAEQLRSRNIPNARWASAGLASNLPDPRRASAFGGSNLPGLSGLVCRDNPEGRPPRRSLF